ncbi:hypothetical protein LXA43DRAFT_1147888 [Ganoderma leucocontextum]|nr:hypothetical protein LXA43DRAFT_1147888 [Ganoderma leucocontextum]
MASLKFLQSGSGFFYIIFSQRSLPQTGRSSTGCDYHRQDLRIFRHSEPPCFTSTSAPHSNPMDDLTSSRSQTSCAWRATPSPDFAPFSFLRSSPTRKAARTSTSSFLGTQSSPSNAPASHGGSTYLKLQLRNVEDTLASILTAELADDRTGLVHPHDRRLAALELPPAAGPSLDALTELLDIFDKRAGKYDPCSRNCLWLADLVLFSSTMKLREVWLTKGRISPDWAIRKCLQGEIDVLAVSTQCFLPDGVPGWIGIAYGALGRGRGCGGEVARSRGRCFPFSAILLGRAWSTS